MNIRLIVPVYNECDNLLPLYNRIRAVIDTTENVSFRLLFIDDGRTDGTRDVLTRFCLTDPIVELIGFTRNFGKESALTAGLNWSEGFDAVITLDSDLQHPPELIPKMLEAWLDGAEVVVMARNPRRSGSFIKSIGSRIYYWIMERISDTRIIKRGTDFRLISKRVVVAFNNLSERDRIFRGVLEWLGFKTTILEFDAEHRMFGSERYSYKKLFNLALSSVTSYSRLPLKITGIIGLLIILTSSPILFFMLVDYVVAGKMNFSPVAILLVSNIFLTGITLASIGLVSIYIGRVSVEIVRRPQYVIDTTINTDR